MLKGSAKLVGGTLAGKGDDRRVCPKLLSGSIPRGTVARSVRSPRAKDPNRQDLSSRERQKALPIRVTIVRRESTEKESLLTPELRDFIDRAIVPILINEYLAECETADAAIPPAGSSPGAARSNSSRRRRRKTA
jgi:hypothetical protein